MTKEIIITEEDGTISFGDYSLETKTKQDGFSYQGDVWKVKTYQQITKLERNGMLVFESVPGTAVKNMEITEKGMSFFVYGQGNAQITLGLEENAEYNVYVDGVATGAMRTKMGGKMPISVDLTTEKAAEIHIKKK